ncbi:MAG: hypothetical protein IPJ94_27530 [Chloroflexi bacterium]|nr:hypothetical protein [Chloroflexota bacterium]
MSVNGKWVLETAVLPTFIKFSQVVGWERPFSPQFIKFSQVVGWALRWPGKAATPSLAKAGRQLVRQQAAERQPELQRLVNSGSYRTLQPDVQQRQRFHQPLGNSADRVWVRDLLPWPWCPVSDGPTSGQIQYSHSLFVYALNLSGGSRSPGGVGMVAAEQTGWRWWE